MQGEIALKVFEADGGGKTLSVVGEKGWRSCQDHAGKNAPSLFLPMVRRRLGRAQTYPELMGPLACSLLLPLEKGSWEG